MSHVDDSIIFCRNDIGYHVDEVQAEKLKNVIVEKNDILLNITGDSIARCTIVPEEILPARVNQHVSIIRCKNTEQSKYVMYYLQYIKKYLLQISKVGGTRNALTKEAIGKLPIKISDDCNKISKILDNIDQKSPIPTTKSTKSWKPWLRPSMTTGLCSLISQTRMPNPTNHQAERWSITQNSNVKSQKGGEWILYGI